MLPQVVRERSDTHRLKPSQKWEEGNPIPVVVDVPLDWEYNPEDPEEFERFPGAQHLGESFKYMDPDHEAAMDSHLGTETAVGSWLTSEDAKTRVRRSVEITVTRDYLRKLRLSSGGDYCRHSGMPGCWLPGIEHEFGLSWDKIDVCRGYIPKNIIISWKRSNRGRLYYLLSDFVNWWEAVLNNPVFQTTV